MASIKEIKNKDNEKTYVITVTLGRESNGKQKRFYMTYKPPIYDGISKSEITRLVDKAAADFETSVKADSIHTCETTFEKYAFYVMQIKKGSYKTRALEKNNELLVRINKSIGNKKLRTITPQDLNLFYDSLRKEGVNKRNGGVLSEKTILEHHRLISMILKKAVDEGILTLNVAKSAESPKVKKHKVNYFKEDILKKILIASKKENLRNQLIIGILATTGCRVGELLGLTFNDLNLITGEISINKSILYNKECGIFQDDTKNYEERFNTLPDDILNLAIKYKEWYINYKNDYSGWQGKEKIEDCFLFIQENGKNMHPSTIKSVLYRFSRKHSLPHINAHAFRHTYASLLILKKIDIVTVSKLMGHTSVETTMKFYSHIMNNCGDVSKNQMNKLFDEIKST